MLLLVHRTAIHPGEQTMIVTTLRRVAAATVAGCAAAALALPAAAAADFGDASILTPFPAKPGFPEGVAVRDGKVYAAGAATFGTTGAGPSAVLKYDRATGSQEARYDTVGENLLAEHGNSSIAFDGEGRLYVLNTQLGTYRLDAQGNQQPYAAPSPTSSRACRRSSPPRARRPSSTCRRCPTTSRSPPTATPT
jgi:hypothetical protein